MPTSRDARPADLHRLAVLATAHMRLFAGSVVSHQSAAAIHRLPMLLPNFRRIHATTGLANGGRRTATRHDHVGTISPEELTTVDGLVVTTIERTAVDVACTTTMGFAGALAVLDAALRRGAKRSVLADLLRASRRGVGIARRALFHATGLAENPGESWSHAQLVEAGLPVPRLQHEFFNEDGRFIARTDFDWGGLLAGEFDGKVKYGRLLRPGESPGDAVFREKKREDALRRLGVMVVRWTWEDLEHHRVAAIVRPWLVQFEMLAA